MLASITAQVARLVYWKSEHDEQTCEDALAANPSAGLFAVADGVGTSLFSNIWARLLVDHFVDTPLLSDDPFEVEWWLRQAQERYQQQLPSLEHLPWNALQKVRSEGSYSTLAAAAITQITDTSVRALLLAFGDSCILVKSAASQQIMTFPLDAPDDFDPAPICLPSRLSNFNRHFHRCRIRQVDLAPGDTLLLATDVVARWVMSAGGGRYADQHEAFLQVLAQTPASWPAFITECRARDNMADDDCAALVVTLGSRQDALLGSTSAHRQSIREQRKSAFLKALQEQNKELIAITYGDGADLRMEDVSFPDDQLQQARQVADALREVLQVLRLAVNSPDAVARIAPVWQKYALLLHDEPAAAPLRQTLARLGIPLAPAFPPDDAPAPAWQEPHTVDAPVEASQPAPPAEGPPPAPQEPEVLAAPPREELPPLESPPEPQNIAKPQEIEEQDISLEAASDSSDADLQPNHTAAPLADDSPRVASPLAGDSSEDWDDDRRDMVSSQRIQQSLERRLLRAINSDDDQEIVAAHDAIRHSPHGHGVVILLPARQRIMLARQRTGNTLEGETSHHAALQAASAASQLPVPPLMLASGLPDIDETWFRKVYSVKQAYLLHWLFKQMEPDQLERIALDDLMNDPLVKAGIDEINRENNTSLLLPKALLSDALKDFKNDPTVGYDELVSAHGLTEDDVKTILLMFLRRQLFEEYLLWQRMAQVQEQHGQEHDSAQAAFRQRLITAYPWISTLSWWEER